MPNNFITMTRLRTIIRLYNDKVGLKRISSYSHASRNTIRKYIKTYNELELSFAEFQNKSDSELNKLFCVKQDNILPARMQELEPLLPNIIKALKKPGMTILLQWKKYIQEYPSGYSLSSFTNAIRRYQIINNPSMKMTYKAGDKLFIDYTGDKLHIYPRNENPISVEVFVSTLGCSLLTYVEATMSQCKEDFISSCENAFYYYGGVPKVIVPDNLKSAVTKANRYESTINEEFSRFAEHYGVSVQPARVRKPKDKSHVENAVKLTYKDIFTKVESLHCPDLKSLNIAIASALEVHNNTNLYRRSYSRRSYYEEIEREAMGELNPIRYSIKRYAIATVDKYGYVRLREDIHYYSVPHTLIGKKLKICYTTTDIDIYDNYNLIVNYKRDYKQYGYTLTEEHLCEKHRALINLSPQRCIIEASELHVDIEAYIRKILETKRYLESAVKSCSGVINLATKVGIDRLAAACRLADSYNKYSYLEVLDILNKKIESLESESNDTLIPEHKNIRGKEYYE